MKPTIYLALTDDWELRGNGSGEVEALQLRPMRELVGIYTRYGVRATFNAEVMQQLTFRRFEERYPELKSQADLWDEHVREAYRQGQDIQLHLHPQWSDASYEAGRWRLMGDWSILNYRPDDAFSMLAVGRDYLEKLLRPLNPLYRCLSFRAGSSVIAPSPFILDALARLGIVFDMSIVGGMRVNTRNIRLDYTEVEESFLPFYPRMTDARKLSDKPEPIVCVPIHHFRGSRRQSFVQLCSYGRRRLKEMLTTARNSSAEATTDEYAKQEWRDVRHNSALARISDKVFKPLLAGQHHTSDLGRLSYPLLCEMLEAMRKSARSSGLAQVPVILTNHSKYIKDFSPLERFIERAAAADDIRFITLSELAGKLQAGEFPIRKAEAASAVV